MTNKFNLDTKFLYQEPLIRDYTIGGGPDLERIDWREKYRKGEDAFRAFVKSCTLADLVYIYTYVFKEKFPNILRLASSVSNSTADNTEADITKSIEFERSDITVFDTENYLGPIKNEYDPMDRNVYETKVNIEFNKTFPISAIEEALQGLSYTTETTGAITTYIIEDSPIKKLEVKSNGFTIYINEEKVVLYYKI